jgi:hypothetical protein
MRTASDESVGTASKLAGRVMWRGRSLAVHVCGRDVYVDMYPIEQYPQELQEKARELIKLR